VSHEKEHISILRFVFVIHISHGGGGIILSQETLLVITPHEKKGKVIKPTELNAATK